MRLTLKITIFIFITAIACQSIGCDQPQPSSPTPTTSAGKADLHLVIVSLEPDTLITTFVNPSDFDAEINVLPSTDIPILSLVASQNGKTTELESRAEWKLISVGAAYDPNRKVIPPHGQESYTIDLSNDYLNGWPPDGKNLAHIPDFDHKLPVQLKMTCYYRRGLNDDVVSLTSNTISIDLNK